MIKLNSAIPLYQQVAEDLKNRIEQGEFCSGQSIPSEAKLCEQYEVSRITIRNAIAIFKSGTWHLGNPRDMNDVVEYRNGDQQRWNNIFFASFIKVRACLCVHLKFPRV